MKCAELCPQFKNDDNMKRENHRPVSVLTAFSKIYIFMNDLFHFINNCNLYNKSLSFDASSLQTVLDNFQEDC